MSGGVEHFFKLVSVSVNGEFLDDLDDGESLSRCHEGGEERQRERDRCGALFRVDNVESESEENVHQLSRQLDVLFNHPDFGTCHERHKRQAQRFHDAGFGDVVLGPKVFRHKQAQSSQVEREQRGIGVEHRVEAGDQFGKHTLLEERGLVSVVDRLDEEGNDFVALRFGRQDTPLNKNRDNGIHKSDKCGKADDFFVGVDGRFVESWISDFRNHEIKTFRDQRIHWEQRKRRLNSVDDQGTASRDVSHEERGSKVPHVSRVLCVGVDELRGDEDLDSHDSQ